MSRDEYKPILRESDGYGYQRLTIRVTEKEAIQKVMDGRYETVSVRMTTDHCWCSICNQDWSGPDGPCFVPGTKITMWDGTTKNIENVNVGEEVLTAQGNKGTVSQFFKRTYKGNVYSVKSQGLYNEVVCTPEHPILIKTFRNNNQNNGKANKSDVALYEVGYDFIEAQKLVEDTEWPIKRLTVSPSPRYDKYLNGRDSDITGEKAYLLGIFAAEGWINPDRNELSFTLNKDEKDIISKLEDIFSKEARIYPGNGKAIQVRFCDETIYDFIKNHISGLAIDKKLSLIAMEMPVKSILPFLGAFIDGDGTYKKDKNTVSVCTASENLANQIYLLSLRAGIPCRLMKEKNRGGPTNRGKQCILYKLFFHAREAMVLAPFSSKAMKIFHKSFVDRTYIWNGDQVQSFVAGKIKEEYNSFVYNLEVSTDNTYVANNIGVHNCEHTPGTKYEDKLAYLTTGDLNYREISFVNIPADEYAGVKEAVISEHKDSVGVGVYANNDSEKVLSDLRTGKNLYVLLDAEAEGSDDIVTHLLDEINKTKTSDEEEEGMLTKEQLMDLDLVKQIIKDAKEQAIKDSDCDKSKKECEDAVKKLREEMDAMKKKSKDDDDDDDEDAKGKKKDDDEDDDDEDAKGKKKIKNDDDDDDDSDAKKKKESDDDDEDSKKKKIKNDDDDDDSDDDDEDAKGKKKDDEEEEEEKEEEKEEEEEEKEEDDDDDDDDAKKKKVKDEVKKGSHKGGPAPVNSSENKGKGKKGGVKHGAGNLSPVGEDPGDSLKESNKKLLDENVRINTQLHKMYAEQLYDLKKELRKPDVVSVSTPDARKEKIEEYAGRSINSLKDQIEDLKLERENALATGFGGQDVASPALSQSDLTNEVLEDKKKVKEGKRDTLTRLFPKSK